MRSRGAISAFGAPVRLLKPAILPLDTVLTSQYLYHVTKQYHGSAKKSLGTKTMNAISFPFLTVWLVGAVLMVAGLANIAGPGNVSQAGDHQDGSYKPDR